MLRKKAKNSTVVVGGPTMMYCTGETVSHGCASGAGPILVIDDDQAVLESLALALKSHGFHVLTARDGQQGLSVFRTGSPVVVVTDILMPEQDGLGAMLQMRRERPEVKVVVMSGGGRHLGSWDYLGVAARLGADAVLRKTVDTDALIDILHRFVG